MRIAYTRPAKGEQYLSSKNQVRAAVKPALPELDLLAFQTRHSPKMDESIPYVATFQRSFIRILSVRDELVVPAMAPVFQTRVVPEMIARVQWWRTIDHSWPAVVVAMNGAFFIVGCSDGWLFPSKAEIIKSIHTEQDSICRYA